MKLRWNIDHIFAIFIKKGDKLFHGNYTGISQRAIKNSGKKREPKKFYCCISGRIQTWKNIIEYNVDAYQIFNDFKQAYDKIDRSVLYKRLPKFEVSAILIRFIRMI